jgi:hypothetical protein
MFVTCKSAIHHAEHINTAQVFFLAISTFSHQFVLFALSFFKIVTLGGKVPKIYMPA